jgi:hypothetical protein
MWHWTPLLLLGGLLVASGLMLGLGVQQWRWHNERRKQAYQLGWWYGSGNWWLGFWSKQFSIAGTSDDGMVWNLYRRKLNKHLYLVWQTQDAGLPYGVIKVVTQLDQTTLTPRSLRVTEQVHGFTEPYLVLATHERLVTRYLVGKMPAFNPYPTAGSLATITWNQEILELSVRYDPHWHTIAQTVSLGETLAHSLLHYDYHHS